MQSPASVANLANRRPPVLLRATGVSHGTKHVLSAPTSCEQAFTHEAQARIRIGIAELVVSVVSVAEVGQHHFCVEGRAFSFDGFLQVTFVIHCYSSLIHGNAGRVYAIWRSCATV